MSNDTVLERRIYGPPGTGKTSYLSEHVHDIISRYGSDSVMVTSFTNTAAEAILSGLEKYGISKQSYIASKSGGYDADGNPVNTVAVGTLHSMAYRALGGRKTIAESKLKEWNEDHPEYSMTITGSVDVDDGVLARLDAHGEVSEQQGDSLMSRLQILRATMTPKELWPESVKGFSRTWEDWKYQKDYIDFTDMIEQCIKQEIPPAWKPFISVNDECQDYNKLQLSLLRQWGKLMRYIVICGDDDQCNPAGTLVLTTVGDVPIERLDPARHRLVVYDKNHDNLHGMPNVKHYMPRNPDPEIFGYPFTISHHLHRGNLYTITVGDRSTRCTPEHRWFAKCTGLDGEEHVDVVMTMHLDPQRMQLPLAQYAKSRVIWSPFTMTRARFIGEVWSIGVEEYESYVADGIVTHNCLYSWSGSTPDAFLDPPIPDEQKRFLTQSYRVPRVVQDYSEQWIRTVGRREPKVYRPRDEDGELRRTDSRITLAKPDAVLNDAQQYLDRRKTVMFLTSCSYMLTPLIAKLKERGITYHNPYRPKRSDWSPLHRTKGTSSIDRMLAFLRMDTTIFGESAKEWVGHDVALWIELLSAKGVLKSGVKTRAKEWLDNYYRVSMVRISDNPEILSLDDILESEAYEELLWGSTHMIDWLEKNLLSTKRGPLAFPMTIIRNGDVNKLHEVPQVIIGTIHSTKGGEAEVTYVFPELSRAGYAEWMTRGERRDSVIRQFYVGMTRPRESLILVHPSSPMSVKLL